jgi:hypothetical protein
MDNWGIWDKWAIALIVYAVLALVSLIPVIKAALGQVEPHSGGPGFEASSHFKDDDEAREQLIQNFGRMRGTLGFWKKQATKYERMHIYCMIWLIILSAVVPVLTLKVPETHNRFAQALLTAAALHVSIISGVHKFFKVEVNFKAFRQGESEFYDIWRRMLDDPRSFGNTVEEQLAQYFKEVSLVRKQVRNAETDTYAGLEEVRQAQNRANSAPPPSHS